MNGQPILISAQHARNGALCLLGTRCGMDGMLLVCHAENLGKMIPEREGRLCQNGERKISGMLADCFVI